MVSPHNIIPLMQKYKVAAAIYQSWLVSETIQNQFSIPHLLDGPTKLLTNLTKEQKSILNHKIKHVLIMATTMAVSDPPPRHLLPQILYIPEFLLN